MASPAAAVPRLARHRDCQAGAFQLGNSLHLARDKRVGGHGARHEPHRVMGILLAKVDGRCAGIDDLERSGVALERVTSSTGTVIGTTSSWEALGRPHLWILRRARPVQIGRPRWPAEGETL